MKGSKLFGLQSTNSAFGVDMAAANDGLGEADTHSSVFNSISVFASNMPKEKEYDSKKILSALLSFATRKNTEELSHRLIERFGDLYGVASADARSLYAEGVNDNIYTLLRLTLTLKKFIAEKYLLKESNLDDKNKILLILSLLFMGDAQESFILLCFDKDKKFNSIHRLGAGSVNAVAVASRIAIETAIVKNARYVILSHNHPNGTAIPSSNDIKATNSIRLSMQNAGVEFVAHYVISNGFYSESL